MYMHSVRKKLTKFASEKLNGVWLSLYMEKDLAPTSSTATLRL